MRRPGEPWIQAVAARQDPSLGSGSAPLRYTEPALLHPFRGAVEHSRPGRWLHRASTHATEPIGRALV